MKLNRVKWSNCEKSGVIIKNKKVSQEDENYTDECREMRLLIIKFIWKEGSGKGRRGEERKLHHDHRRSLLLYV